MWLSVHERLRPAPPAFCHLGEREAARMEHAAERDDDMNTSRQGGYDDEGDEPRRDDSPAG